MEAVLAVPGADFIRNPVEIAHPLRPNGVFEEAVLDVPVLHEFHEHDARRPVKLPRAVHVAKEAAHFGRQLHRVDGGPAQPDLPGGITEVVSLQKGPDPPGGEAVAPGLDAGRLQVPHQVSEKVVCVAAGGAKRSSSC